MVQIISSKDQTLILLKSMFWPFFLSLTLLLPSLFFKPSAKQLISVFEGHIKKTSDALRWYFFLYESTTNGIPEKKKKTDLERWSSPTGVYEKVWIGEQICLRNKLTSAWLDAWSTTATEKDVSGSVSSRAISMFSWWKRHMLNVKEMTFLFEQYQTYFAL